MAESDALIQPDETAFALELTPAQLKVTHAALCSLLDGFGHEERDVRAVVRSVLAKLPDDASIRAIDLTSELKRLSPSGPRKPSGDVTSA
jgi:hypothetical protein